MKSVTISASLCAVTLLGAAGLAHAQDNCTYHKDAQGNVDYTCPGGKAGRLREDSLGNFTDPRSGEVYRPDRLGKPQSLDGTRTWQQNPRELNRGPRQVCRQNTIGQTVCSLK